MPRRAKTTDPDTSEEYIDAFTDESLGHEIPARLLEFARKWHGTVKRIQVQYASQGKEDWKFTTGHFRVPYPTNPSPEKMAIKAMELASRHAEDRLYTGSEDELRYRAVFLVFVNGKEVPKRCRIRASMDSEGTVSFDDDEDRVEEKESIMIFRDVMMEMREDKRELMAHVLASQDTYTNSVAKLGEEVQNIAGQVAAITQSLAGVAEAATAAITEAGQLYRASEAKSAELRRIELEAEQIRVEQEASERKFDGAMQLLKQSAPLILGKLLKTDPSVLMAMLMQAQGQDPAAMMANMKAMAETVDGDGGGDSDEEATTEGSEASKTTAVAVSPGGWVVPPKPRGFDPSNRDFSDLDLRESLTLFFHQLDEEQERTTRRIVGAELYDFVRTAADRDDTMSRAALVKVHDAFQVLPSVEKGKVVRELMAALGESLAHYFLGLVKHVSDENADKPN